MCGGWHENHMLTTGSELLTFYLNLRDNHQNIHHFEWRHESDLYACLSFVVKYSFALLTYCRALNHHTLDLLSEAWPPGPRRDLLLAACARNFFLYLQSMQIAGSALM